MEGVKAGAGPVMGAAGGREGDSLEGESLRLWLPPSQDQLLNRREEL